MKLTACQESKRPILHPNTSNKAITKARRHSWPSPHESGPNNQMSCKPASPHSCETATGPPNRECRKNRIPLFSVRQLIHHSHPSFSSVRVNVVRRSLSQLNELNSLTSIRWMGTSVPSLSVMDAYLQTVVMPKPNIIH